MNRVAPLPIFLAMAAITLGQTSAKPAFLDERAIITYFLDQPAQTAPLTKRVKVTFNGKDLRVRSVKSTGAPIKERTLPRTPGRVTLPGTFAPQLGGNEWDPDGEETQMSKESDGVYTLVVRLRAGTYQYKVARNGSWSENYGANFEPGGANLNLIVPSDQLVRFRVDINAKTIRNSIEHPSEVPPPTGTPRRASPRKVVFPCIAIELANPITPESISGDLRVSVDGRPARRVYARNILDRSEYIPDSTPLGPRYTRSKTTFRVWSPVSQSASLLLSPPGKAPQKLPMRKEKNGIWSASVAGDLHGAAYQYRFVSYGQTRTTQDIYCKSATPDSQKSIVVDLTRTDIPNFRNTPPLPLKSQTDAIIYEASVRDFSVRNAAVPAKDRGKVTGLIADTPGSGVNYLQDLGITHLHLLPVQNFLTGRPDEYTWGYATNLFNVPEETYSPNPTKPFEVIRDYKRMVAELHKRGIRVVLDVVYNHTWPPEGPGSAFWQTVPYYYVRTNDAGDVLNESGVGNALADERTMASRYVRDSLVFWAKEYQIDGFRFDLLGLHNPKSVDNWAKAVRAARASALIYGEPWTGGGPLRFGKGAQRGMNVAVFNDNFRGVFRGDLDGNSPSFITGSGADLQSFHQAMTGWTDSRFGSGFAATPAESVNYVSAHDNRTLWDRIGNVQGFTGRDGGESSVRMAIAATLLSQGVPFFEGGIELGRTKGGNHNSYNAGDQVNGFNWERAAEYENLAGYMKSLIAIRKANPVFRLSNAKEVAERVKISLLGDGSTFRLDWDATGLGGPFNNYVGFFRSASSPTRILPPEGNWRVLAYGPVTDPKGSQIVSGETLNLQQVDVVLLAR